MPYPEGTADQVWLYVIKHEQQYRNKDFLRLTHKELLQYFQEHEQVRDLRRWLNTDSIQALSRLR